MWWEIIPSAGVVFAALMAPHGAYWALNKIFHNGKVYSYETTTAGYVLKLQIQRYINEVCRSILSGDIHVLVSEPTVPENTLNLKKSIYRNPFAPELIHTDQLVYVRDERITGSRYIPQGLEAIPDEPPCP